MSSARRSDPQRSAPQDKKNVVLPYRRTTFLSLRVLSWGGQRGRTPDKPDGGGGAARGVLLRNAGPERQARQRAAGGGNERRTLGKRNERQATERQTAGRQGRQGRQSHQGPKKPSDEKPSPGERPPQQPHKARHGADGPLRPHPDFIPAPPRNHHRTRSRAGRTSCAGEAAVDKLSKTLAGNLPQSPRNRLFL